MSTADPRVFPVAPVSAAGARLAAKLAEIGPRFQRMPATQLAAAVRAALQEVLEAVDMDRISITEFSREARSHLFSYAYWRPGLPAVALGVNSATAFPTPGGERSASRRLVISHLPQDLPEASRAEFAPFIGLGMKSLVLLPLEEDREIVGYLAISSFREHREFSAELQLYLDLLASIFASALQRSRMAVALEESLVEQRALKERLENENAILARDVPRSNDFGEIVGRTPALSVLLEQVRRVASTDAPVLVLGETGTGKGLVARAIHDRSPRSSRPLVTVNCAALPPTLIDSELFGYEKGAFTGAIARTPGRFEVADRGTLLLDEIGELPLDLQAKLLRVLQSGEFERLGSSKTIRVDVRLIAATNRDLEREVREGRFRADLFYRLSVFPLTLPPLRNRPEDIPLLVWHCIARRQAPLGRRIERVPERMMRAFSAYSWPGNIRELENVVERALILSDGATLATDPMFLGGVRRDADAASGGSLSDVERQYILEVLHHCGWKVAGKGNAADRLGLNRSTLLSRMKKLGISRPELEDRKGNRTDFGAGQAQGRPPGVSVSR